MSHSGAQVPEEAFRRLTDSLPGFTWILSLTEGRPCLLYANPALEAFFGRARESLAHDFPALLQSLHPEDRSALTDLWSRLLRGERVTGEFRFLGPEGQTRLLRGQAFPLDQANLPPRLVAGFFQDAVCPLPCPAEAPLAWEAEVNTALAELSRAVINSMPLGDLSRLLLDKAKGLTRSEWGSVSYLDQNGRELVFPDLEGEEGKDGPGLGWDQERWQWSARWARCLAERQVLVINEPLSPEKEARPCFHRRFLCLPAVFGKRLLGQIALATRRRDYEPRDLEAVERLASLFAITLERQQAEEALRESEERFRSLVETMSDLVWETDASGRFTYVSPNVYDLLGYRPEEVLGQTFLELLAPEEAERLGEFLSPVLESQKPYVYVGKTILHPSGQRVVFESSGVPILDYRGQLLGYRGIDRNITERHRAAETLFREKEKYRILVEESPLGVAIIDPKGAYQYVNPKFVQIFGYDLADIPTGRDWFVRAYPDPDYRAEVMATWLQDLKGSQMGEARPRTFTVTCKDASQKIINFRSVTLVTGDQLVIYEDVTEHHRAEAALRESEAKYRLLVSNIPAVVFRGYPDWSVEVFDDKVEELTGYTREDFNSRRLKWSALIIPEDLAESQRLFRQALKTTGSYIRQYRIRHKNGHILWVQARGQIVRNAQNRIDYIYGVFFDITKQKEVEEALRESEEHLKTIMDSIQAGVIMIDAETRYIVEVNRYAAEMVGMHRKQLIGRKCHHFFCPIGVGNCPGTSGAAHPVQMQDSLLTTTGATIPILRTVTRVKKGGRSYLLESFLDLTQQKRVEEALAAEKERLQVTLRSIGDGVMATDTEGKVVLMNQVAEALTGWTQEEAWRLPIARVLPLVHELTRKPCDNPVDCVIRTGRVVSLPAYSMLLARDGAERILAASAAPIIAQEGEVIGVVLVFQDVTTKRQTEAELLKMEKLTSLGLLAGGIAHDFNNILTGLLGNLSLAMLASPRQGQVFRRLAEAEQASLRARDLVQQLLTFAKGGAPVKEVASLEDIIRESATFACRGSQVRCDFTCPPDLLPVEVDPGQISQVIQNLAINAIQAMPAGGTITIRAQNVALRKNRGLPLPPGKYVKISVTDHGIGIHPDYLSKIFDPYFSTKQKGSGLGLATAYSILKNHDGYMTVESTLGVGTSFFLYLPASAKEVKLAPKDAADSLLPGTGRILVMDDDAGVRQVAGKILKHLGYEVDFAEDGAEAIEKYQEALSSGHPFDAVIMDLTIPGGMGGKEALQALLKIAPEIRAIVSSGYADDPIMTHYQEYGFSGVIKKPYKVGTFSHVLHQILQPERR